MAYYLAFGSGADGYGVTFGTAVDTPDDGTSFELWADARHANGGGSDIIFLGTASLGFSIDDTNISCAFYNYGLASVAHGVSKLDRHEYKVTYSGDTAEFFVDGTSVGTVVVGSGSGFNAVEPGINHTGSRGSMDYYGGSRTVNGVLENYWDPSASNGTGSVLPDTSGTNDGTLVNFETDDSQWVSYAGAPSLTITPADLPLTPGATFNFTYSDYDTVPATLTGTRGSNVITSAGASPQITGLNITDNGDGTGSGTATLVSLPTSGTLQFLRFSDSGAGIDDPVWELS